MFEAGAKLGSACLSRVRVQKCFVLESSGSHHETINAQAVSEAEESLYAPDRLAELSAGWPGPLPYPGEPRGREPNCSVPVRRPRPGPKPNESPEALRASACIGSEERRD